MNLTDALKRKLIYVAVIALLLLPLYQLGRPMTQESGGALAEMRADYGLAESNLGEIDPASNSMRLATLGMRGVAATLLWKKSDDYKKMQEWDRLSATLDVIALLQPHFEKVWEHQAWNMSYNVSVEFDDYRQRYNWVKKGTEYLMRGVRRNRRAPRLEWYTGWFFGQKLGVSDEKRQFRKLFADDDEFHKVVAAQNINIEDREAKGPFGDEVKADNWLVGRLWMKRAYDLVDKEHVPLLRKNPLHFYQDAALWRTHHSVAIEEEGVLDERAGQSWRQATEDWRDYGRRDIPTYDGYSIRLGDLEEFRQRSNELTARFEKMTEGLEEKVKEEKFAALTDEENEAIETIVPDRTKKQAMIAELVDRKLQVTREDIVKALPESQQLAALQLLSELATMETKTNKINGYRNQTNFDYWYTRSLAEQEERTLKARQLILDAETELDRVADIDLALQKYEQAFVIWRDIFDDYPVMVTDTSADDLAASISRYLRILDKDELDDDFPLKVFLNMKGTESGTTIGMEGYIAARNEEKERDAKANKQEVKDEDQTDAPDSEKVGEQPKADSEIAVKGEPAEKPMNDAKSESSGDDEPKPDLKAEEKEMSKAESKEEPDAEAKEKSNAEATENPKDGVEKKPKAEVKKKPKAESKKKPKTEVKEKPTDDPKDEPKSEAKDEPKGESEEEAKDEPKKE